MLQRAPSRGMAAGMRGLLGTSARAGWLEARHGACWRGWAGLWASILLGSHQLKDKGQAWSVTL